MSLYPAIEPYDSGMLDVGGGNLIYWEACGNPNGKPAVVLHGGPGSGCTPWSRRLFDPSRYRIVLFDQRNCGRSRPHASFPDTSLVENTTWQLVADIERLREFLGIERWLVLGGSWGSVLALAYAVSHPGRVSEMVLFGVATGRHQELDWLFRGGLAVLFPEEWERLRTFVPAGMRGLEIVEAYHLLLEDPATREAAANEWARWESATPDWPPTGQLGKRFEEPAFAIAFARIVTHYVRHNLWMEKDGLLPNLGPVSHIPVVLINGRFDLQSPIANAWTLNQAWPASELVVVEDAGHSAGNDGIARELIRATDRFAGA